MITFNTDGMLAQYFAFPAPIMDYILKNLQPQHLIKLYQCCKFFYAKYRQNIIRNLVLIDDDNEEEEMFHPNKTVIRLSNPTLKKLIDFWITDSFIYNAPSNLDIMPNFSHCTIKKLEACDFLVWEEFEALTKAGTIEELKIGGIYRDLELVPVEELIAAVPNATSIEICESTMTPTSFESLIALNLQVKITKFILLNIRKTGGFRQMKKFLYKHADADCNVRFGLELFDEEEFEIDNLDEIRQINEERKELENFINKGAAWILRRIKKKIELNFNY